MLTLYGLSKTEKHFVAIIGKNKLAITKLRDFLIKLGFNEFDVSLDLMTLMGEPENKYSKRPYSSKLYQDKYFYFENKEYKTDIFFGKNKVIVSIFTKKDKQKKLAKLILEFCEFAKKNKKK